MRDHISKEVDGGPEDDTRDYSLASYVFPHIHVYPLPHKMHNYKYTHTKINK